MLEISFVLRHLGLGLSNLSLKHGHLRASYALFIHREFVGFFSVVERRLGDHAILGHLHGAIIGALEEGNVRTFGVHLGALVVSLRALQIGLRGLKRSL